MINDLKNLVRSMIRPLRDRVYTMITRSIVESIKDSEGMQTTKLTLLAGETRDGVERFQNFGFTSNPPARSECVALSIGGNRDHLIVIAADDRKTRLKNLSPGESAVFTDDGTYIKLLKGGKVEVLAANEVKITSAKTIFTGDVEIGGKLDVTAKATFAGDVDITGNLNVTGDVTGGKIQTLAGIDLDVFANIYNTHTHGGGTVPTPDQTV